MEQQEALRQALTAFFPPPPPLPPSEPEPQGVSPEGEAPPSAAKPAPPVSPIWELGLHTADPLRTGAHLDVHCSPDQVVDTARIMDAHGFFLETITGVDWPDEQQLELIYDYNTMQGKSFRVAVRVRISRTEPQVTSIVPVFPAADWHERETFDFFGVHFQGHPNLIRILLPEDADFYPLLKDFMP